MNKTNIEWTDSTWNPIRGCTRVSEGCRNCYAEAVAARFSDVGQPYHGLAKRTEAGPRWTGDVRFIPHHLEDPLHWTKPRKIFVNSMSDLFHEGVPDEWIEQICGVMSMAVAMHGHIFQILTKRPERMQKHFMEYKSARNWAAIESSGHIWWGVSVEDQKTADHRIPYLVDTPVCCKWLSVEPQLEEIDLRPFLRVVPCPIHWVVDGGESGFNARPFNLAWAEHLMAQCAEFGVPFFMKQLGSNPWVKIKMQQTSHVPITSLKLKDRKGGDITEWPQQLQVRQWPIVR